MGTFFGNATRRNLILSIPNKVLINFDKIRRHSGGVIDIRVVLKTVVRAWAIYAQGLAVTRDRDPI